MHTFLVEQPELNWRNPDVEAAQLADGPRLARSRRRRLSARRVQRFPQASGAAGRSRTSTGRRPWARQHHLYDRDQPDFPELIGRFRAILDEQPGRMSVGELFASEAGAGRRARRGTAHGLRLGAAGRTVVGRGLRRGDLAARGDVRRRALAGQRAVEPRSVAAGQPPRGVGGHRRHRRDRQGGGGRPADDPRHAVPVLRRGARDARCRRPGRRDHRPAGPPGAGRPRIRVVEPRPMPLADALDERARSRLHDRVGHGSASATTRERGTSPPRRPIRIPCCRPIGGSSRRDETARRSARARSARWRRIRQTCWRGVARRATNASWSSSTSPTPRARPGSCAMDRIDRSSAPIPIRWLRRRARLCASARSRASSCAPTETPVGAARITRAAVRSPGEGHTCRWIS